MTRHEIATTAQTGLDALAQIRDEAALSALAAEARQHIARLLVRYSPTAVQVATVDPCLTTTSAATA
ncbi:hypothetical protein ACFWQL_11740 [Amycolatopsis thermoflava]|uniref:hypothetical protein n=1 Tax=Amycolatopsis thermoflava TaxID=84480 RepID=UPI00365E0A9C